MTSNIISNIFPTTPPPSPTPWTEISSNVKHLCMDNKINKQQVRQRADARQRGGWAERRG
tara:strand:+ start:137 stop:316 length:180 start_codon:yes stop_codon:yes gene_type:complete